MTKWVLMLLLANGGFSPPIKYKSRDKCTAALQSARFSDDLGATWHDAGYFAKVRAPSAICLERPK